MASGGGLAIIGADDARAASLGAVAIGLPDVVRRDPALLFVTANRFAEVPPGGVPILVLDARDDPGERAALLDAGAADVVSRGADPLEISARARAILRRAAPMVCADLAVDVATRRAARGGRSIALHPREFAVLAHLARHRDRVVARRALYSAVWHRDFDPGTNVVAVAVSRLRAKVDEGRSARLIHTVADGYMLSAGRAG